MNWDQIKGKWNQAQGSMRQKWGDLTDDDVAQIHGDKDILVGKLQERYGIGKEEAERQANEWAESI